MSVPEQPTAMFLIRPEYLAEKIASDLMTNGNGDTANRLVLESVDGKDLGGWSMTGIILRIAKHLTGELKSSNVEEKQ